MYIISRSTRQGAASRRAGERGSGGGHLVDAHGAAAAVFAERTPAAVLADGASFALLAGGAYLYICMQILYTDTNTHTHSHTHTQCV